MADKLRDARDLASLQARYGGTGSADTKKHEFVSNVHRDTLSSFVGHPSLLHYAAIGCGKTREQMRVQLLERMIRPIGPPPSDEGVGSDYLLRKKKELERKEKVARLEEVAAKEKRAREIAAWGKK